LGADQSNRLQLLQAYQPGTFDTSFVSSDNIVNPRTMNALYDLTARLRHASRSATVADRRTATISSSTISPTPAG
jgi:hypothetical protein